MRMESEPEHAQDASAARREAAILDLQMEEGMVATDDGSSG